MAQYMDYAYYQAHGGTLSQADFPLAEFKARSRIDFMTLGRVQNMETVPDEVKMAMLVLMKVDEKYAADAQAENAIVSSYNTDGYSESYGGIAEQTANVEKQAENEVSKMLFGVLDDNGVPLIYRGLS